MLIWGFIVRTLSLQHFEIVTVIVFLFPLAFHLIKIWCEQRTWNAILGKIFGLKLKTAVCLFLYCSNEVGRVAFFRNAETYSVLASGTSVDDGMSWRKQSEAPTSNWWTLLNAPSVHQIGAFPTGRKTRRNWPSFGLGRNRNWKRETFDRYRCSTQSDQNLY
jgi:hypothetical protein